MVISRVIIRVTPFRALITLLITYLLSPLPLQVYKLPADTINSHQDLEETKQKPYQIVQNPKPRIESKPPKLPKKNPEPCRSPKESLQNTYVNEPQNPQTLTEASAKDRSARPSFGTDVHRFEVDLARHFKGSDGFRRRAQERAAGFRIFVGFGLRAQGLWLGCRA